MDNFGRIRICDRLLFAHAEITKNVKLQGSAGLIIVTATKATKPEESLNDIVEPIPLEKVNLIYKEALIKFGLME